MSNQIVFSEGIGLPDKALHLQKIVLTLLESGHLPTNVVNYEFFPGHHLYTSFGILLSGTSPQITYFCILGFIYSIGILSIYSIGKRYFSAKYGLLVAAFFPLLDYYIMYGSHPEHQAFNYSLSLVLFFVLLLYIKLKKKEIIVLFILVSLAMVFTHHFSALLMGMVIFSFLLIQLYEKYILKTDYTNILPFFFILLSVLLTHWIYYSGLFINLIHQIKAYLHAIIDISPSNLANMVYDTLPLDTIFVNTIGSGLFALLSIIGFIKFAKLKSKFSSFLIILTIMIVCMTAIGLNLKIVGLLPDRLYPFLQIFSLIFFAVSGMIFLITKVNSNTLQLITTFLLIFIVAFFSQSSTISGFETSLFCSEKIAYFKLYDTPHNRLFEGWKNNIGLTGVSNLPVTLDGTIDLQNNDLTYIKFDSTDVKTGYVVHSTGYHMGEYHFIKMKPYELKKMNTLDIIYSNGIIQLYMI